MTVQELIDTLSKIEDKSKRVFVRDDFIGIGTLIYEEHIVQQQTYADDGACAWFITAADDHLEDYRQEDVVVIG